MSFTLANIKRVLTEEAQDESTSPSLKDHNPFTFALPSAKLVNLIQPYYLDEKKQLSLLTDVETYLLKSQKMLYLKQVEYFLPGIIYWFKPIHTKESSYSRGGGPSTPLPPPSS